MTVEQATGWTAQQFDGRLGHYERLPDTLSKPDLAAVARAMLPNADAESIGALVNFAIGSSRYLAGIDAVAKRARYIATKSGRTEANRQDVRQAIKQNIIPSDSALASALKVPTPKERAEDRARHTSIDARQRPRRNAALHLPAPREQTLSTAAQAAANRSQSGFVPVLV